MGVVRSWKIVCLLSWSCFVHGCQPKPIPNFLCATGKEKFHDTELGKFLSDSDQFRSEDAFSIHIDNAVYKKRGTRIEQLLFLVVKNEREILFDI